MLGCFVRFFFFPSHLVEVKRGVDPLAQRAVALHERVRTAIRFVVVQDVVADRSVSPEVRHERHLAEALNFRLGKKRPLRVLVTPLLQVAKHDPVELFLGGGGVVRHPFRRRFPLRGDLTRRCWGGRRALSTVGVCVARLLNAA